ncbi:endonuclease MutS2 [Sunxiuqinia elliptica]|uniref:Endonuclease MutS2 n=1 Tax=Sunxiuqinia elliptica TaxID=655355 RepID=A0A4R6GNT6_9BACT|nr:Smr/MutS family protein [Sunxiuqinia elliptica]TDN96783.1 DNA mismatch repair protein MutS2 [Sunxiuqinia elliptica]TDO55658.1 DNA mismatch repair protein MutS2 [Sunxiuqinia elliptica]
MAKIYPHNFETKIGFDRVRQLLKSSCLGELGKDRVDEISFLTDYRAIQKELAYAEEFVRLMTETDNFPTNYYFDLRKSLSKIRTEGRFLEVHELFDLKRSLETITAIIRFLGNQKEELYPNLRELVSPIQVFPYIKDRIEQIISQHGKIKDQASPELGRIRRELLNKQNNVSKRLHSILKQAQRDGLVDEDTSVSIRDGRPVIPVSSAVKRRLNGIVHDESATGKTAYIEPAEVVEINNEIRELEYAEKREIVRILVEFSDDIRPYLDELMGLYDFLGTIDLIRAKARVAIQMDAIKPYLDETPQLLWEKAVHPLLRMALEREKRPVVPLNIELSPEKHLLLISGPNAGGKSVCLKTVGLLQYMLQCGLLIPVDETSRTGVFDQLFIDIGDEQSIENDLSTYSSHLMNMKHFLKFTNDRTLVLIDEFGTGTEPMIGGAIAEAILDQLNQERTFGVITTHYTNLKHFASSAEGIENGAMLYDNHRMEPLFQLQMGKPGSSFAFEIARKIGMPESILEEATQKVGKDHINFDKHLRDIVRDKRYWESKRQRIRKVERSLDELADKYEHDLGDLASQRKQILAEAKEEATRVLAEANKKVENTIREIRESQAEKEKTRAIRKQLTKYKEEVVDQEPQEDDAWINKKIAKLKAKEKKRQQKRPDQPLAKVKTSPKKEKNNELVPGDKVRIEGQNTIGEILELGDKNAVVAFGQLRTSVSRKKLQKVSNNEARSEMRGSNRTLPNVHRKLSEKRNTFKPEIDVRGQRAEEAIANIQAFIDEAIMLDVREVRILHGKGNGILREMIRSFLGSDPAVRSFRDEHVQFGGAGITIVEIS